MYTPSSSVLSLSQPTLSFTKLNLPDLPRYYAKCVVLRIKSLAVRLLVVISFSMFFAAALEPSVIASSRSSPTSYSDFNISVVSNALSIPQGSSSNAEIRVTGYNDFQSTVYFSVSGAPWGVDVTLWQDSVYVGSNTVTSMVTFTVGDNVPSQLYYIYITGTSREGTSHSALFRLQVTHTVSYPDFAISVISNSLSVSQGNSVDATIYITSNDGFSSNVYLTASNVPPGVNVQFSDYQVYLGPSTTTAVRVTITADPSAPIPDSNSYVSLTGTGAGGSPEHTCVLELAITN